MRGSDFGGAEVDGFVDLVREEEDVGFRDLRRKGVNVIRNEAGARENGDARLSRGVCEDGGVGGGAGLGHDGGFNPLSGERVADRDGVGLANGREKENFSLPARGGDGLIEALATILDMKGLGMDCLASRVEARDAHEDRGAGETDDGDAVHRFLTLPKKRSSSATLRAVPPSTLPLV